MNRRLALSMLLLGMLLLGMLLLGIGAPLWAGVMSEEAALGLDGTPVPGAPPASMGWDTAGLSAKGAPFDRVVWDRTPIRVLLPVGRERRLDFPAPVSAGLPGGALPAPQPGGNLEGADVASAQPQARRRMAARVQRRAGGADRTGTERGLPGRAAGKRGAGDEAPDGAVQEVSP